MGAVSPSLYPTRYAILEVYTTAGDDAGNIGSSVGTMFEDAEVIVVVAMVAYESTPRINGRSKKGREGRLKTRTLQEVKQEGEGEDWAVAVQLNMNCL